MSLINDMLKDLEKRHAEEAYPKGVVLAGIGMHGPASGMRGAQWLFYLGGILAVAILVFVFTDGFYPRAVFQDTGTAAQNGATVPLPLSEPPAGETDVAPPSTMVASIEPPAAAGRPSGAASVRQPAMDNAAVRDGKDTAASPGIAADGGGKADNGVKPDTAAVSPKVTRDSDALAADAKVPVTAESVVHGDDAGDMTAPEAAQGSAAQGNRKADDGVKPDAAADSPKAVAGSEALTPNVKHPVTAEAVDHAGDAAEMTAAFKAARGSGAAGVEKASEDVKPHGGPSKVAAASDQRSGTAAPVHLKKIMHPPTIKERARQLRNEALRLARRGELDLAEDNLSKALSLEPDHVAARGALAGLMIQNGQLAQAAALLDRGLTLKPGSAPLVELRARVYVMQGDNQRARALLEKNAPEVSQDPEYHAMLAAVYQRLGDYDKAGAVYQALVHEKPQNGVWWLGLGLSMEATGRVEEARQAYQKAQVSRVLSPKLRQFVKEKLSSLS